MDLTTLPSELLVIALKYIQPAELVPLRKRNKLIDQVAKRFALCERLPVDSLCVSLQQYGWEQSSLSLLIETTLVQAYNLNNFMKTDGGQRHERLTQIDIDLHRLPTVLQKVRVINEFEFGSSGNNNVEDFDGSLIEKLEKEEFALFKDCKAIRFFSTKFVCTKGEAMSFINLFPKAVSLSIDQSLGAALIINSEVLGGRKWLEMTVVKNYDHPQLYPSLDDLFLDLITINGTILSIGSCSTKFSYEGVLSALQIISDDERFSGTSDWGIVQFGEIRIEYAKEKLGKIPGIQIKTEEGPLRYVRRNRKILELTISFLHNKNVVKFTVENTNLEW